MIDATTLAAIRIDFKPESKLVLFEHRFDRLQAAVTLGSKSLGIIPPAFHHELVAAIARRQLEGDHLNVSVAVEDMENRCDVGVNVNVISALVVKGLAAHGTAKAATIIVLCDMFDRWRRKRKKGGFGQ